MEKSILATFFVGFFNLWGMPLFFLMAGATSWFSLKRRTAGRYVNGARIRQAFQNLLNNALHHTPSGGVITVNVFERVGDVEISVQDTGIGISAKHLPHVFDRFYRADASRSREDSGVGLGLAIVQAIIQAHGGDITAFSTGTGKGSTFTITLP